MFDPALNPLAWFDESLVPEGWFDSDLIPVATVPRVLLAAFVAVQPDYAHPQHDHHDRVAIATADFLALTLVVVVVLKRLRAPAASG
jgi:hypothetical protein